MTTVEVSAGICGFCAVVTTTKTEKRTAAIRIESDCEKITDLAAVLSCLELNDIFDRPFNTGTVYEKAGQCNIHASCPVPCAVLKAAEVEMGIALKQDVEIRFKSN